MGAAALAAPLSAARPAFAWAGGSTLSAGQELQAGQDLVSSGGQHTLVMQTDGNLVVYGNGCVIWASNTTGTGSSNYLAMQGDGNLVVYTGTSGTAVWASKGLGCYGNGCTGLDLDPVREGCDYNVQTLASVSDGDLTVNLRYSPGCYAVWAQPWGRPPPTGAVQLTGTRASQILTRLDQGLCRLRRIRMGNSAMHGLPLTSHRPARLAWLNSRRVKLALGERRYSRGGLAKGWLQLLTGEWDPLCH